MVYIETHYLIDYENVHEDGLSGCKDLRKSDYIVIFFTQNAKSIDMSYATAVSQVREFYDGLSDYDKQYIDNEQLEKLSELEARIKALQALADMVASSSKPAEEEEELYEPVEEVIADAVAQEI